MTQSLRLGFITSDLSNRHGWASYSLNLLDALRRMGVEMTAVAARDNPPGDILARALLPTVAPPERATLLKCWWRAPQVRAALRDCDVIHCTVETYAPLAALVAGGRPLFVTGHGSYVYLPQTRRFPVNYLYEWAFRRATLVCVSRYTARVAEQVTPGVRVVVVNNGVHAARFAKVTRIPQKRPVVLSVGAVKERKGTLELVQAVARVRDQIPNVQCVIVGSLTAQPDYAARVAAERDRLGLRDCVRLLGHVSDETLLDWYGAADVFALPSLNQGWKFEGYGLALMEASAAGLPVIGTTDCGAEDAVEDGVTGLLISQARIAEELPAALIRLLTDSTLAARFGAAGRARAQRQTWDAVAQEMVKLYRQSV